jgi:hypothetical protein
MIPVSSGISVFVLSCNLCRVKFMEDMLRIKLYFPILISNTLKTSLLHAY